MFRFLFRQIANYKWSFSLLSLILIIISSLPFAIQYGIEYAFKQQGADSVAIKNVDLNLFNGHLTIEQLEVQKQQQTVLSAQLIDIQLDLSALLDQQLLIESSQLHNASILAEHHAETLHLAGWTIPLKQTTTEEETQSLPLEFGIQTLQLHDIHLQLQRPQQSVELTTYSLHKLQLNNLYMWDSEPAELIINSHLNQSLANAHLWLHLFHQDPKIVGTIKTHQLNLAELPYLAELIPTEALAKITTDLTFTAQKKLGALHYQQQGNLAVEQARLALSPYQTEFDALHWAGDLDFMQDGNQPELKLKGLFKLLALKAQDSDSNSHLQGSLDSKLDMQLKLQSGAILLSQNGSLNLQNLAISQAPYQLQSQSMNWQGKLNLTAAADTQLESQSTLKLSGFKASDGTTTLSSDLTAKLDLELNTSPEKLTLLQAGNLQLSQINAQQAPYAAKLEQLDWQGRIAVNQSQQLDIESQAQINLHSAQLTHQQQTVAAVKQLSIKELLLKSLTELQVNELLLSGLEVAKQQQPTFIELDQLHIDQAWLPDPKKLIIGTTTLSDSQTHLVLNKEGKPEAIETLIDQLQPAEPGNQPSLEPTENKLTQLTADTTAEQAENADSAAMQIQWHKIQFTGQHHLHIVANQFDPPLQKKLQLTELTIGALNSSQPTADTPLKLKVVLDEFTEVSTNGVIQPLNPNLKLQLESQLSGINLIDLSPVSAKFIGYNINSGQLDATLSTEIADNKINAENKLKIHKLAMKSTETEDAQEFDQGLSMPVDAALSLLRDKNDNISLKLPIKGQLDDPNFDLQDIINTALSGALKKATKAYLLLALQPFGAIALLGDMAIDQSGSIELQAITFKPGEKTLSTEMKAYLRKLNKLLSERKGVQITACGVANEGDRQALLAKAKQSAQQVAQQSKQSADKNTAQSTGSASQQIVNDERLLLLAKQRGEAIKRALIHMGTANSQVVLCQPTLEMSHDLPKVKLGI